MSYKRAVRQAFERLTGTRIYRTLPRGIDIFEDIRNDLPATEITTVFDVGANVGQSAEAYLKNFPKATIYCFEPISHTFRTLQKQLKGHGNAQAYNLALGAEPRQASMVVEGSSDMFFVLNTANEAAVADDARIENVTLETIDGFCSDKGIETISYLKIDTEGSDLEVLKGAEQMLGRQKVDIIEVESGMNHRNDRHVAFDAFTGLLGAKGYFLFGIYEQVNEWPTSAPNLRRTNPVFISDRVVKANVAWRNAA